MPTSGNHRRAARKALALVVVVVFLLLSLGQHAAAQVISWIDQFGTPEFDMARGVAVDGTGSVYVVGRTAGSLPGQTSSGGNDAFLRKYDPEGMEVWTHQFGTPDGDEAFGVVADGAGSVYVVGSTSGTLPGQTQSGSTDAFVRKYDAAGMELWTRQFGSTDGLLARGVAVDAAGNAYVVGWGVGALPGQTWSGNNDAFLRKYDPDGTAIWTRQFGTSGSDVTYGVAVDGPGYAHVAGDTNGVFPGQTSSGIGDAFLRKYDPDGTEVWTRQFGTSAHDRAEAVLVDEVGTVYGVGYTDGTLSGQTSAGLRDAFIRKYDPAGSEVWTRQFGTSGPDEAIGAGMDASGSPYVAGGTDGSLSGQTSAGGFDAFVRKYDGAGNAVWTHQFGGPNQDVARTGPAVDAAGSLYVAGDTSGILPGQTPAGYIDAFVAKISDNDGDGVNDTDEDNCGADSLDPGSVPERLDGAFSGVSDDGDVDVDEALPPGSETFDCDGDGWSGEDEEHVFSAAGTANDQDPCGTNGWPPDIIDGVCYRTASTSRT